MLIPREPVCIGIMLFRGRLGFSLPLLNCFYFAGGTLFTFGWSTSTRVLVHVSDYENGPNLILQIPLIMYLHVLMQFQ